MVGLVVPEPTWGATMLTPARRRGLAYERKVGQWLRASMDRGHLCGLLWDHPWVRHEGVVCSPDFILESDESLLVLEVKLSETSCQQQKTKYCHIWPEAEFVQVTRRVRRPATLTSLSNQSPSGTLLLWL